MIILKNKASTETPITVAAGKMIVPFDSLVANTNSATEWRSGDNSVVMKSAGRFNTHCTVVLSSTAGGDASLSLIANGEQIDNAIVETTIEAAGTQTLVLDIPVSVIRSAGSDSYLQWQVNVSAASKIENAFADIQGIR